MASFAGNLTSGDGQVFEYFPAAVPDKICSGNFLLLTTKVELHQAWITVNVQSRQNPDEILYTHIASLRTNMSFVLDNLWSYIHIDVLEVQWAKLQSSFKDLKGIFLWEILLTFGLEFED